MGDRPDSLLTLGVRGDNFFSATAIEFSHPEELLQKLDLKPANGVVIPVCRQGVYRSHRVKQVLNNGGVTTLSNDETGGMSYMHLLHRMPSFTSDDEGNLLAPDGRVIQSLIINYDPQNQQEVQSVKKLIEWCKYLIEDVGAKNLKVILLTGKEEDHLY